MSRPGLSIEPRNKRGFTVPQTSHLDRLDSSAHRRDSTIIQPQAVTPKPVTRWEGYHLPHSFTTYNAFSPGLLVCSTRSVLPSVAGPSRNATYAYKKGPKGIEPLPNGLKAAALPFELWAHGNRLPEGLPVQPTTKPRMSVFQLAGAW